MFRFPLPSVTVSNKFVLVNITFKHRLFKDHIHFGCLTQYKIKLLLNISLTYFILTHLFQCEVFKVHI